jgi:tripartite motif-containing protein 71
VNENYEGAWYWGWGYEALDTPGVWRWSGDPEMRYYLPETRCAAGSSPCSYSGRGLFIEALAGWIPANTYQQWYYTVPGSTTFIPSIYPTPSVYVSHFWRNNNNCTYNQVPEPHDYAGTFDASGKYTSLQEDRAQWYGGATIYDKAKGLAIGLSTRGQGVNLPCNRKIMVGGVSVWLDDPEKPTLTSVAGFPSGWVKGGQSFTATANIYDPGLGVQNVGVYPKGRPEVFHVSPGSQCSGGKTNPCPYSRSAQFSLNEGHFDEGEREVQVSGYDPTGEVSNTIVRTIRVDRTAPKLAFTGTLATATDEDEPDSEDPEKWDELARPIYSLSINATDGSNDSPEKKRSGVKRVEIYLDDKLAQSPWRLDSCASSCEINRTYDLQLAPLATGKHKLKVVAYDWLEQSLERTIEFEYFPATGDKDEYVMERFPLPDGTDPEASGAKPWPELSVNVATGNVLFEQRDIDVEGPAVDLEVERVYNSLLPPAQDTEWGDGWTMAQTPSLEPAAGAPDQADVVDPSGSIEDKVPLPTEVGQEQFDPGLQAVITKRAGGGYELDEESAEAAGATVFDSTGRTQKLLAEGAGDVAEVDYSYEEGVLSGITVEDPTSSSTPPPEPPPVPVQGKPAFATSLPTSASVADVARDAEGGLWVVSRTKDLLKLRPDGSVEDSYSFPEGFTVASAVAIDGKGNRLVADLGADQIFVVGDAGIKRTIGTPGTGPGQFVDPRGIAVDRKGNIWVTDSSARLQKFTHSGTFLGSYAGKGSEAGQLNEPKGLDVSPGGEIWVADWANHRIAVFDEAGAFVRNFGSKGEADGQFVWPLAVDFDNRGFGWVSSFDGRVQGFSPSGAYYSHFGSKGYGEGQFSFPFWGGAGLVADASGRFWITDAGNGRIQKWETPNYIPDYTPALASSFGAEGSAPGSLSRPRDIAMGPEGDLWVVDPGKHRVQRFSAEGEYVSSPGTSGSAPGQLNRPTAIAFAPDGGFWVTDSSNNRIQKFSEEGQFELQAGSLGAGAGQLSAPEGVAVGPDGRVWVSDTKNSRLQVFSASGAFEKTVGGPGAASGQFAEPMGLDFGPNGNVYVADAGNHRIQVLDANGNFVAEFGSLGSGSGQFQRPGYVEVDEQGYAWVSDSGNDRILVFGENGEYIRKFGSKGFGPSEFELTPPSGLTSDAAGRTWVVDPGNVRIQKWVTPAYEASELVEAEPDVPNDPAVEVEASESLIATVEGTEAGAHSYEHAGDDLVAHSGPEGETKYEYNSAGLMTKVELPNGTMATMTYDSLSSRVKTVTVDPSGAEPAKTTYFSYEDAKLKATVEREGAPKVDYYFNELGAVFRMWHASEPPEVVLSGSLWVNRESPSPIHTGLHNLEVQAESAHGIASIEVMDGGTIVSEKFCSQDHEAPGVECQSQVDEWVVETLGMAPGIHEIEVLVIDSGGRTARQRFWINIPYTLPPSEEEEQRPTFSAVKNYRQTHGLDLDLNPITQEQLLNDRIYDLLGAWGNPGTEEGRVARYGSENWGVPMRAADITEMEYREWYIGINGELIDEWGEMHYPGSYAGYVLDAASGGRIKVGFTQEAENRVDEMKAQLSLAAEERIASFAAARARSIQSLEALTENMASVAEANDALRAVVSAVRVDRKGNFVQVMASDPTSAKSILASTYGADAPIVVTPGYVQLLGSSAPKGAVWGGERIKMGWVKSEYCTAGYGVRQKKRRSNGEENYREWLLTAGHCKTGNPFPEKFYHPRGEDRAYPIGEVDLTAFPGGRKWETDALGIKLNKGMKAGRWIFRPASPRKVTEAGWAPPGDELCFSGVVTGHIKCGESFGLTTIDHSQDDPGHGQGRVIEFDVSPSPGDSGSPVWNKTKHTVVGILIGREVEQRPLLPDLIKDAYVAPLIRPKGASLHRAPGILDAPGMGNLDLIESP